ncbi:DEAD/DEAH box helicase [Aeromonas veronii]|uniref:DEAD/DEAH box helicase n=1 Tax=Aeromonas veronii TaxID=654 RepID=UPI003D1CC588
MTTNNFNINDVLWNNLRTCQKESINVGLDYIKKPFSDEIKSCLISLPTGAGKSGVIAILCHQAMQKRILVLCHRRAVCDQLILEVSGGFFSKITANEYDLKKTVFSKIDDTSKNGIYISTFQKLQSFNEDELKVLKNNIDLIIIDEGHSEPSPVWRTLVRGLKAHKIVITATPYRNDLFQFDINGNSSFIYSFERALSDGILCEPTFKTIEYDELINHIQYFFDLNPGTKCIIKCNKFSDIIDYYNLLNSHFKILAIHEQYANDKRDNVKSSVPKNLKESAYDIIIHQRKLDEGVDIPQAKLLILTYPVNSGRELVQTIGRVVRLFDDVNPEVVEFTQGINHQIWLNYRKFDASLSTPEAITKFIASLDTNKLIDIYLDAFPDASYYGNRFLSKFNINDFTPSSSLIIPTASVCFLNKSNGFSLHVMSDLLFWRSNNAGELAKQFDTDFDIKLIVSIAFNKSKFLKDHFFFEPSLEITLLKEISKDIIAVYDSRGRRFDYDEELNLGSAIVQDKLFSIMSSGESVKTTEASSKSFSTTKRRPQSVVVKGDDLDKQLVDTQGNAAYRLATLRCDTYDQFNKKSGSFYVGVDSGRISDQKDNSFSLAELNDWLEHIAVQFTIKGKKTSALIDSFAKPIQPQSNLNILSVIFDFSALNSPLSIKVNGNLFSVDNNFIYREFKSGFLLDPNIADSHISANLIENEPFFQFSSDSDILFSTDPDIEPDKNIIDFLAKNLHCALLERGIGYSSGRFYQLQLPIEKSFSLDDSNLSSVIVGLACLLNKDLDEKGFKDSLYQVINNDEFSEDSIFYLLDKLKAYSLPNPTIEDLGPFYKYIPEADLVINTDMGTEPADFILSSTEKLVYVHVKCGSSTTRPQSSAGGLAEVGSQAIKNIEMLTSNNTKLKPGNWTELLSPWPKNSAKLLMNERIRMFNRQRYSAQDHIDREKKLNEVWDLIAQRRSSHAVRKEIWIVAANSFSRKHFSEQLAKGSTANSESLQAYQLIQSWLSNAHSNDVELKIFVSP